MSTSFRGVLRYNWLWLTRRQLPHKLTSDRKILHFMATGERGPRRKTGAGDTRVLQ